MKIGFVIGDWKGKIEIDGTIKEGEEENLGRVFMSKDGMNIVLKNPWGEDIKVVVKAIVGCSLVIDGREGREREDRDGYNTVGFKLECEETGGGGSYVLGPFMPPTELELKSWYLVMKMLTQPDKIGKVKTMILAELTKTVSLVEAVESVEA